MRFQTDAKLLKGALSHLNAVAEKRHSMPILAHVLIEAKGGEVTLRATDLETALTVRLADVKGVEDGCASVPCKKLLGAVGKLAGPVVVHDAPPLDGISLAAGSLNVEMTGSPPAEWPTLPDLPETPAVPIDAAEFARALGRVLHAASSDGTRYHLNVVFLEQINGAVRLVTTDGHRLALAEVPGLVVAGLKGAENSGALIPILAAREMLRQLKQKGVKAATLALSPLRKGKHVKLAVLRTERATVGVRCVDTEFPRYRQVIPQPNGGPVVDRSALLGVIERVLPFSSERSRGIQFRFGPAGLNASASNPDLGEAHEEMPCDWRGDLLEIGFNGRYLIDALKSLPGDTVTLDLADNLTPILIGDTGQPAEFAVVMPMRV